MSRELDIFKQVGQRPVNTNLDVPTDSYNYQEWMRKKALESIGQSHPDNIVSTFEDRAKERETQSSVAVDKFKDSIDKQSGDGTFNKVGNAVGTTIGNVPSIINQLQTEPESRQEANAKVMSLAASGGQIGGDIGGIFGEKGRVLGQVAGTAIGAVTGIIDNVGWQHEFVEKKDKETLTELGNSEEELLQNYIKNKSSSQLKKEQGIYAKSLGYSSRIS